MISALWWATNFADFDRWRIIKSYSIRPVCTRAEIIEALIKHDVSIIDIVSNTNDIMIGIEQDGFHWGNEPFLVSTGRFSRVSSPSMSSSCRGKMGLRLGDPYSHMAKP